MQIHAALLNWLGCTTSSCSSFPPPPPSFYDLAMSHASNVQHCAPRASFRFLHLIVLHTLRLVASAHLEEERVQHVTLKVVFAVIPAGPAQGAQQTTINVMMQCSALLRLTIPVSGSPRSCSAGAVPLRFLSSPALSLIPSLAGCPPSVLSAHHQQPFRQPYSPPRGKHPPTHSFCSPVSPSVPNTCAVTLASVPAPRTSLVFTSIL